MINWLQKFEGGGQITPMRIAMLKRKADAGDVSAKEELEKIIEAYPEIAEVLNSMKNGGRFKLLDFLKCGGKTKKVSKKSMGGCSCKKTLARKNGGLVNIDCNGNILK